MFAEICTTREHNIEIIAILWYVGTYKLYNIYIATMIVNVQRKYDD